MTSGQPSRPANVENIVAINQGRQPQPREEPQVPALSPQAVRERMAEGHLVLDTRHESAFGSGHVPGAYNVQLGSAEFEQRVGWALPPHAPLLLVTEDPAATRRALHKLAFVGLARRVRGVLDGGMSAWLAAGHPTVTLPQVGVHDLQARLASGALQVLDVRDLPEWRSGHIDGARHVPYRALAQEPGALDLDPETPLALICASGQRSSIAGSLLLRQGFTQVSNVTGGMNAWEAAGLETS